MRNFILIGLFLSIFVKAFAAHESAVSRLNAGLVPIYESLVTDGQASKLVGKQLELNLSLKHASDRFLLFTDTQIVLDKNTKYYLIKWEYETNDIRELVGKSDVVCKVKGRIVDVVSGVKASGMPYIIVELISVEI